MNGSRIALRSVAKLVRLSAQSLRAASSAGLWFCGHASTSPFAIATASATSLSAGLDSHAAVSAVRASVYRVSVVGFMGSLLREQGDQGERAGVHGERAGPDDI